MNEQERDKILAWIDKYTIELGITCYPYVSSVDLKQLIYSLTAEDDGYMQFCPNHDCNFYDPQRLPCPKWFCPNTAEEEPKCEVTGECLCCGCDEINEGCQNSFCEAFRDEYGKYPNDPACDNFGALLSPQED